MMIGHGTSTALGEDDPASVGRTGAEVMRALRSSGYSATAYPGGIVMGVRLSGVPGSRSVHVDIVSVLDAEGAGLQRHVTPGRRAVILDRVNMPLDELLRDTGLAQETGQWTTLTPWGRVSLETVSPTGSQAGSVPLVTRTVYVVAQDVPPSVDLSWLTTSSRVLSSSEFALALSSDARAVHADVRGVVCPGKWAARTRSVSHGWSGLLALVLAATGLVPVLQGLLSGRAPDTLASVIVVAASVAALVLLSSSRSAMLKFEGARSDELEALYAVADGGRIRDSLSEHSLVGSLVRELTVTVSALMASVCDALCDRDAPLAMRYADAVIDELVRAAGEMALPSGTVGLGDRALDMFLSVFHAVGVVDPEMDSALALAYASLSGSGASPLSEGELVEHLGTLNNALFMGGILSADLKRTLDDTLNDWSMRLVVRELDRALEESDGSESGDDSPTANSGHDAPAHGDGKADDDDDDEVRDLLDRMIDSALDSLAGGTSGGGADSTAGAGATDSPGATSAVGTGAPGGGPADQDFSTGDDAGGGATGVSTASVAGAGIGDSMGVHAPADVGREEVPGSEGA